MRRLNRNLTALLAIALMVSLLAVSGMAAPKQELVVYAFDIVRDQDAANFYKDFEVKNNVKVKTIIQTSDKFVQSFMVAANGGQPIDVVILNGQDVRSFASKGLLLDLSKNVKFLNRFYPNAAKQYRIGGKLYALPTGSGYTTGLYYNKEIFNKYGLQPPKTYAELVKVTKELNKNGIAGIALGGADKYKLPLWYFAALNQTTGNNGMERTVAALEGKAKFTDPDYVEAMGYFEKYAKDELFQKGFIGADAAAMVATFASGKSGMFYGGTWEVLGFNQSGLTSDKLGMVPWVLMKDGVKSEVAGAASGGATALYAKSNPKNRALALKLIDYITSDKKNLEILNTTDSFLTTNKNVERPGADALTKDIQKNLVPVTITFFDWYWPPQITKAFQDELQAVLGQMETPQEAMVKIQKVYDEIKANGYDYNAVK